MKESKDDSKKRRRGRTDETDLKKTPGQLIGLDIGYGFTKIVREDGECIRFPSAVAAIAPTAIESYGGPTADDEVVVERVRCIVGDRAIGKSDRFPNLHNVWWTGTAYKAIIAHATQWIPPQSTVVTGLPLHTFFAPEARAIVHDIVKSGMKAKTVLVSPQGVGAYYSDPTIQHPTNKVAIVDVGTWTTELIGMAGNDFLAHVSAGLVLGVSDIFATVAQELKEKLGRTVDPYEVERAARGEGDIRAQGRAYPQTAIDERITQLAKERASQILAKMTDLWGLHGADFETILFCGGGAQLLFPYLKTYREGVVLLKDAQFANARGFLQIADNLYGTEDRNAPVPPTSSQAPTMEPGSADSRPIAV